MVINSTITHNHIFAIYVVIFIFVNEQIQSFIFHQHAKTKQ